MTAKHFNHRPGVRHLLAVLAGSALAVSFSSRASISVLLVAMTAKNSSDMTGNLNVEYMTEIINGTETAEVLIDNMDMPRETQGLVLSAFFWGYLILQVPGGSLAQRYGGKWILATALFFISLLNALIPLCAGIGHGLLIGNLALQGVASSVTFPATIAMLGRWAPRTEVSSLPTIALSGPYVGSIFGQILAGGISASVGWKAMFYINSGLGFLWLLPWLILVTDSPSDHPRISQKELLLITEGQETNQAEANRKGVPWRRLICSREALVYIPLCFCHGWASYSLQTCLPQFLSDVFHINIFTNGLLASIPTLAQVLVANLLTHLVDRAMERKIVSKFIARKLFTVIGFWGYAIAFFTITQIGYIPSLVVGLVITGNALLGGIFSGYFATPMDVSPEFAGTLFAIGNIFMTSAGAVAPIVANSMTVDKSKLSWMKVFGLGAGVAASGGLIFLIFGSSRQRRWDLSAEEEKQWRKVRGEQTLIDHHEDDLEQEEKVSVMRNDNNNVDV